MIERLAVVLGADDLAGVLTRDVRVRLVNISGSGCLVETSAQVEPGTIGVLRVHVDGEDTRTIFGLRACSGSTVRARHGTSGRSFCGPPIRAAGHCAG